MALTYSEAFGTKRMIQSRCAGSGTASSTSRGVKVKSPIPSSSAASEPGSSLPLATCNSVTEAWTLSSLNSTPSRAAVTRSASISLARSMTATRAASGLSRPARTPSSVVSKAWAKRTSASKPNAPAPPLMECTARNTELTVSSPVSPASICRRPVSRSPSPSSHSWKNVSRMAAIGSTVMRPKRPRGGRRPPVSRD